MSSHRDGADDRRRNRQGVRDGPGEEDGRREGVQAGDEGSEEGSHRLRTGVGGKEQKCTVMVPTEEVRKGVRKVCKVVQVKEPRTVTKDLGHWETRWSKCPVATVGSAADVVCSVVAAAAAVMRVAVAAAARAAATAVRIPALRPPRPCARRSGCPSA